MLFLLSRLHWNTDCVIYTFMCLLAKCFWNHSVGQVHYKQLIFFRSNLNLIESVAIIAKLTNKISSLEHYSTSIQLMENPLNSISSYENSIFDALFSLTFPRDSQSFSKTYEPFSRNLYFFLLYFTVNNALFYCHFALNIHTQNSMQHWRK